MGNSLHVGWVLGWAVPVAWFKTKVEESFPTYKHTFIEPSKDALVQLTHHAPYDIVVGYSLGSLLLLNHKEDVDKLTKKVVLLSPIIGFTREMNLGGKIKLADLKATKLRIKRNPQETLRGFYALADLTFSEAYLTSFDTNVLSDGLDMLESMSITSELPQSWMYLLGEKDALLDSHVLKEKIPHLILIKEGTHAFDSLLKHIVQII